MMEIKHIAFETYTTPEGKATCGTRDGRCLFLGCRHFGSVDVCLYPSVHEENTKHPGDLLRQKPYDTGYLIPHRLCPFHGKES